MPTTFSDPDFDTLDLLSRTMERHHQKLYLAHVRVGVILATNPDGPAITIGRYPSLSKMSVVSLKDRLKKNYDAELVLDAAWWESDTTRDEHRAALIDHDLCYLELAEHWMDEGGFQCKRDDLDRPKLKIRKGDWFVGPGFYEVCRRHGDYAHELANMRSAMAIAEAAAREDGK